MGLCEKPKIRWLGWLHDGFWRRASYVAVSLEQEQFVRVFREKPQPVWGCPLISSHVRQRTVIDGRCDLGRPGKDQRSAGGDRADVHADTSNRIWREKPVDAKCGRSATAP